MEASTENSQFGGVKEFLDDEDLHLTVHPSVVTTSEQDYFLEYRFDIDGVVVEPLEMATIKMPLNYVSFEKLTKMKLKPAFHLLKKHLCNNHFYYATGFSCLVHSRGIKLAESQGWTLTVAFIPAERDGNPG
ncbi:hypothetical protein DPEC_G00096550 [Dallia pectoralis]|uniref:Uncharacterized protein n=1 Tax=Dallia pectoralis TaxID=75939 RepID=A0ACC2GVN7_DALPE|nr:hypothetical protein DPEC_G00096550 [Dallia pectoralis]